MRTEYGLHPSKTGEVLAATGTGTWCWHRAEGRATLDRWAARLMGLPLPQDGRRPGGGDGARRDGARDAADGEGSEEDGDKASDGGSGGDGAVGTVTVSASVVRSRLHAADFVELENVVTLAAAEGTVGEARLRVVGEDGRVLRTVRARLRHLGPARHAARGRTEAVLLGTVTEVPHTPCGRAPGTGDRRRAREAFLLDAGRALAEARSTAEVLRVAATLSMPGFSPEGLAVFGREGDRLSVTGHHGHRPGADAPFDDMPLDTPYPAADVVRSGRAVYLTSPAEYQRRFPLTWPLAEPFGRQSWAFLPLVVSGRTIGAWMASFASPVAFTPDERSVLTTVARMLAQALSRTSAYESERELAAGLQRTMRPVHRPDIDGMTVAARYVPTGGGLQVGGDWYDVIPLASGRTALVMGDVQGHDVRAASVMAQLRVALRAYAAEGHRPGAVLSRTSRFLAGLTGTAHTGHPDAYEPHEVRFATCLYVEVDPGRGTLDVVRAGHLDPAVRLPDGTLMVRPTAGGLPLGIDPDTDYPTTRLVLGTGETLLLCTDGLVETGGHDLETGWSRIRRVVAEQRHAEPEELAEALLQAVHGPSSHHRTGPLTDRREDDIALLLLRRDPVTGARAAAVRRTVLTVAQADASRVGEARGQLRDLLYDWSVPDQVDGAVLMLSEVLTNVLVHTDADALMVAEITGERGGRRLRVEVADGSDELPHRRDPGELASSGRGLVLLDLLAGAWGVDPRGEGKAIWFELREDAPAVDWG
ncbi:SpoIIE family protein phosphatase [Streptomyces sp. TRM 70351]|uniref:ATP-binding SpoIIE family protein phosphatase n=1 Tax=Streptomyces sp. TRM 70351 TaxID=3116552 RepID=UPI002E7BDB42|nr:SpoIIE family protein phosphatase [Streptomyces sp. TRM 70351]MEE1930124.1 SpoIIE family protein phosphatase [Streptomyces sp. TRM 70351]